MLHAWASVLTTDRGGARPISPRNRSPRRRGSNAYNALFMGLRHSGPRPKRPSVEPVENLIDHPARMLDVSARRSTSTKPHFSSTRIEPTLLAATHARGARGMHKLSRVPNPPRFAR